MFIEIRAIPRLDQDGNLVGLIHVVRDITERKEAEKLQQGHLHFLQALIDTMPAPIFYKNHEGIYLGCNKAFEEYVGLRKEQIIGKTVFDIAPRDLAEVYRKADETLFKEKGVQIYESSVVYAVGGG